MSKTGIFYGSTTGNTQRAAQEMQKAFGDADVYDIYRVSPEKLLKYDNIIFGASTWYDGSIQGDCDNVLEELSSMNLKGKKIAIFGFGNQEEYADHFADGMGVLYDSLAKTGATMVGSWPTHGYNFENSKAKQGEKFVGLVLDEENQPEMTSSRIRTWLDNLKENFK